jgi:hypothetical protein
VKQTKTRFLLISIPPVRRNTGLKNVIGMKCSCIPSMFLLVILSGSLAKSPGQRSLFNPTDENLIVETETSQPESGITACLASDAMSNQERSELIQQLEATKALDYRREQQMLNNWWTDQAPAAEFEQQKEVAQSLVTALKTGARICWSSVEQALKVPVSPY